MPYPDNFNERAFQRHWGDSPEWEDVWEANAHALNAAIKRAFDQYPANARLRAMEAIRAYGLFLKSLNKYMPLIGTKNREKIDKSLERLMGSIDENEPESALQDSGDIAHIYNLLLKDQYDDEQLVGHNHD